MRLNFLSFLGLLIYNCLSSNAEELNTKTLRKYKPTCNRKYSGYEIQIMNTKNDWYGSPFDIEKSENYITIEEYKSDTERMKLNQLCPAH